jgi:hypothetical protein
MVYIADQRHKNPGETLTEPWLGAHSGKGDRKYWQEFPARNLFGKSRPSEESSFRRKPESRRINALDTGFRRRDGLIGVSLDRIDIAS